MPLNPEPDALQAPVRTQTAVAEPVAARPTLPAAEVAPLVKPPAVTEEIRRQTGNIKAIETRVAAANPSLASAADEHTATAENARPGFFGRVWSWTKGTAASVSQRVQDGCQSGLALLTAAKTAVVAAASDLATAAIERGKSAYKAVAGGLASGARAVSQAVSSIVSIPNRVLSTAARTFIDYSWAAFDSVLEIGSNLATSFTEAIVAAAATAAKALASSSSRAGESNTPDFELAAAEKDRTLAPTSLIVNQPDVLTILRDGSERNPATGEFKEQSTAGLIAAATMVYAEEVGKKQKQERDELTVEEDNAKAIKAAEDGKVRQVVARDPVGLADEELPETELYKPYITQADLNEIVDTDRPGIKPANEKAA